MSHYKNQYVVTAYIYDKRGRLLSVGRNCYSKTHPTMVRIGSKVGFRNQEKTFLHAEINAINKCINLDKAHVIEVFVYSERSNTYCKSRPCPICNYAIAKAGIPFIRYQNRKGNIIQVKVNK